jgi:hypothetical protein
VTLLSFRSFAYRTVDMHLIALNIVNESSHEIVHQLRTPVSERIRDARDWALYSEFPINRLAEVSMGCARVPRRDYSVASQAQARGAVII